MAKKQGVGYFITGSDTGVGKTVVTAVLAATAQSLGKSVCVYKPIQTGSPSKKQAEDLETLNGWLAEPVETANTYNFTEPVCPYIADEAGSIDPDHIQDTLKFLLKRFEVVLVEGAGGVRVPVAEEYEMADLMKDLALPVLLVVRPSLGTINHTLLSVEALQNRKLEVAGVVVSNFPEASIDPAVQTLPEVFQGFLPVEYLYALPSLDLTEKAFLKSDHPVVEAWMAYELF